MFGISGAEFMVLLLVVVLVVGPQRLPEYTRKLTQMVRQLRLFVENTKAQIAEEVGPELADLNLKDLDPRQYDPRKIVRDALGEDIDAIRNELTHPFDSVVGSAKEVSDDAAQAVNEKVASARSSKSLSQMIEDKKQETLKEREAQDAAEQAAVTTELPQVEVSEPAGEGTEPAESAEPSSEPVTGASAESSTETTEPAAEDSTVAGDAKPAAEDTKPAEGTEQTAEQAEDSELAAEGTELAAEDTEPAEAVEQSDDAEPAAIPSSLAPDPVPSDAASARPLSPRQIILAARQAARTPAEAARASVSA